MDRKHKQLIITMCVITIIIVSSSTMFASSVSGYQSITAEWYQVRWPNAQETEHTLVWPMSGTVIQWDGDDTQGVFDDKFWDRNSYSAELEQPKFLENIDYHEWWINDTVSAASPTGEARHFEWSIDLYTLNVNFRGTGGVALCTGVEFWVELKNNIDSVFKVLGAEDAASYIIYAQTEEYTWEPESAPHHIILPTVSNFELFFLDVGETVSPGIPEEGSDLDFSRLEPYSHVAIKFVFDDFGTEWGDTEPVVNMLIELNVLTVGRFDYVLTYVAAGEDQVAPRGQLGFFDGIGAALAAGFDALMDGFVSLTDALVAPLMAIAVITVCVLIIFIVLRRK